MNYISVREAATRWGISERRVRALCESGRIEGATHVGEWVWGIPSETQRPADGRTLRYMKNRSLRTGIQNFSGIEKLKKSAKNTSLTEVQKTQIIIQSYAYDERKYTVKQLATIFALKQSDVDFASALELLNMRGLLNSLPTETTEKSICEINKRLLVNIDEKNGGVFKDEEAQKAYLALIKQYAQDWSVLHPIVRSSFIFTELLRIMPFKKANTQTAFAVLTNEMITSKLPPVIFDEEATDELRAALASAKLRGNTQQLVSMIIEAVTK